MIRELTWQSLRPEMVINDSHTPLVCGDYISFSLSQDRHCIGYRVLGAATFASCPDNTKIPHGKDPQCEFCKRRDVSFTAKTGYGTTKQAGELLSSEHIVYLAYFSDQTIKVGVALKDRKEIRVSEQGAIACLFIANGTGTVARNFERRIHMNVGLTEWVRTETKLKALEKEPSKEQAHTSLIAAYEKVKILAASAILFDTPEYVYLYQRYDLQQSVFTSTMLLVQEIRGNAVVCGNLVGVYGKVILLQIDNDTYAIPSQLLCGFSLHKNLAIDSKCAMHGITTKTVAINRQQSLLDFL